jgi:hypothetical protein
MLRSTRGIRGPILQRIPITGYKDVVSVKVTEKTVKNFEDFANKNLIHNGEFNFTKIKDQFGNVPDKLFISTLELNSELFKDFLKTVPKSPTIGDILNSLVKFFENKKFDLPNYNNLLRGGKKTRRKKGGKSKTIKNRLKRNLFKKKYVGGVLGYPQCLALGPGACVADKVLDNYYNAPSSGSPIPAIILMFVLFFLYLCFTLSGPPPDYSMPDDSKNKSPPPTILMSFINEEQQRLSEPHKHLDLQTPGYYGSG